MKNTFSLALKIALFCIFFLPNVGFADQVRTFKKQIPQEILTYLSNTKPLNEKELIKCVSGNTMIGKTCSNGSFYELFFEPNGTVTFRKNHSDQQVYVGKWWVKGHEIYSQWPTYKSQVNRLKYFHLIDNAYVLYNVTDSCGPAKTFGAPFLVFEGDVLNLKGKGR